MWDFVSPTRGFMTLSEVLDDLVSQIQERPKDEFRIIVGTDSQAKVSRQSVTFVTALIIHHVGKGARYYIHREQQNHIYSLRQRMFTEASYSLHLGGILTERLQEKRADLTLEVHLDVGEKGATRQLIREIVSWITANGYEARVKPDSFGASKVADRYTRI